MAVLRACEGLILLNKKMFEGGYGGLMDWRIEFLYLY
jgi:hypothetical protein